MAHYHLHPSVENSLMIMAYEMMNRYENDFAAYLAAVTTEDQDHEEDSLHLVFMNDKAFNAFSIAADAAKLTGEIIPTEASDYKSDTETVFIQGE